LESVAFGVVFLFSLWVGEWEKFSSFVATSFFGIIIIILYFPSFVKAPERLSPSCRTYSIVPFLG
jgi:hypothetical protein